MHFPAWPFDAVLLTLVVLVAVAVFAVILQILVWRRLGRLASVVPRLDALVSQLTTVQATIALIDQRVGRLHSQLAEDNAQLREQIGARLQHLTRPILGGGCGLIALS